MSQTRHTAAIENLEDASLEFGRRIGSLIQKSAVGDGCPRRPQSVGRSEAAKNSPRQPRREDSGPSRSANV